MYKLIYIKSSTRKDKKFMAKFCNTENGREKTTHFGAKGMSDYTIHIDPERKERCARMPSSRSMLNTSIISHCDLLFSSQLS